MGYGDDWDRRRDDPAAKWNQPRKPRGKKDRRRWCRGKEGVEHDKRLVLDSWYYGRDRVCGWTPRWKRVVYPDGWRVEKVSERGWYSCGHIWQCANCGKKFDLPKVCPDRQPD